MNIILYNIHFTIDDKKAHMMRTVKRKKDMIKDIGAINKRLIQVYGETCIFYILKRTNNTTNEQENIICDGKSCAICKRDFVKSISTKNIINK